MFVLFVRVIYYNISREQIAQTQMAYTGCSIRIQGQLNELVGVGFLRLAFLITFPSCRLSDMDIKADRHLITLFHLLHFVIQF